MIAASLRSCVALNLPPQDIDAGYPNLRLATIILAYLFAQIGKFPNTVEG
jgi:hypothetical protein